MMSDEAKECYQKYHDNVAFAVKLETNFSDNSAWSCVVRFYAALHLMNAYLIDKANVRLDPSGAAHLERKKAMERCPELRDAPSRYRELKDMSEWVRYDAGFVYQASHHRKAKSFLDKIAAIVEPKLKSR
jgi:hypothetical protein